LLAQDVSIETSRDTIVTADTVKRKSQVDEIIYYNAADSIVYAIGKKKMNIYGKANIRYKEMDLKSGEIDINWDSNILTSRGIAKVDTSDTSKKIFSDNPILKDGGEEYKGSVIKYNFKTQQGNISFAETESDGQKYYGEKIKKIDKETYFIQDGIYTTCSSEEPHYYFSSSEMKVILKEQIIAKWIWLHFADVPFPIPLPFGVFPNQSGRRSGIIAPAYGERDGYGRYFSHFGYFWAISDYMDINLLGDFYTKGGYALTSRFRYVKRYDFNGSIEVGFTNFKIGEPSDINYSRQKDYKIGIQHHHELTPTSRIAANLSFVSSNFIRNTSTSINELLNDQIISNATYYKAWEESGASISISYNRVQNLSSGNINETLPSMNFYIPPFYPFKKSISSKSKAGESLEERWYEMLAVNYSSQLLNRRNKVDGQLSIRGGINHNASIFLSPKIGYFNITPRFNYVEQWYNKKIERYSILTNKGEDSIVTKDVKDLNAVRTFNMEIGVNTKFYGMFRPNFFGITAIRHTLTPAISYNFQPDFSDPQWGYFGSYVNSKGQRIKYSFHEREVFGGARMGEQQNISFNVRNNFEMKTSADPKDTTAEQKKYQLLNIDGGISYDFAADSLKFSELRLGFYTNIGNFLSFGGSSSFDLYKFDENIKNRVNKFLINERQGLARLTNFSITLSFNISGEQLRGKEEPKQIDTTSTIGIQRTLYEQVMAEREPDFSIPWNLSLNYNYSLNKHNPKDVTKFSNLSLLLSFNLTSQWKFYISGSYDIFEKRVSAPVVRISRDLHCWNMNFEWYPIGSYRGFRFELRVKAPQLQDLKITKQGGVFSR
jgi:lipopolysaccharide assembly outer membrane protein LptD (OstA)